MSMRLGLLAVCSWVASSACHCLIGHFVPDPVVLYIPLRFAVLVHALPKNCIVML